MTLYPAFRCTFTVRIFLAMYWLVPCISPLPKSEASCAPALVEMLMLLPSEPPMLAATSLTAFISINRQDVSTSINTQMDALIPPSKISGLTQGMFVGSVSDNFNERIEQKIFHCEIVVDAEKVKREESAYKKIPVITDFTDENGNDCMKEMVQENYNRIKSDVKQIVADELQRIHNDPALAHLLQQK